MPKINGLTPKMVKFCEGIVSGMMPVDAYKNAYNAKNMKEQVIRNEANKLMQRNDITEYVEKLRIPLQNHARNVGISEREAKKAILWDIIHDADEKTENRLRAIDILNRMDQDYLEQQIAESKDKLQDLDTDQLKSLLRAV